MNLPRLIQTVASAEGYSRVAYWDNRQHTYGYGTKAPGEGATITEAMAMEALKTELADAIEEAKELFPAFDSYTDARQEALAEMVFNLGKAGVRNFKRMCLYISRGEWEKAGNESLKSKWATQVGRRATRIANTLITGDHYEEG